VGKILSVFLFALVVSSLFLIDGCLAATCDIGEYYYCELDDQYNTYCECECISCPNGQTSNGRGEVNYCKSPPTIESGCYAVYCQGYDSECPTGVGMGMKCKAVSGCGSPCQKYEVCNPSNGNITTTISGQCHIEGGSCYPDTRECKEFEIDITGGEGEWTCKKEYQTGSANWDGASWDVGGCKCNKVDISADGCDAGVVMHARQENYVQDMSSKIPYKQTHRYCRECAAGKVPTFSAGTANYGGVTVAHHPQSGNGDWGVWKCGTVSAPYYAEGCDIDFIKDSFAQGTASCKKLCGDKLTITSDGATSAAACVPDGGMEYTDDTGTFTLGSYKCDD